LSQEGVRAWEGEAPAEPEAFDNTKWFNDKFMMKAADRDLNSV
jgi:hypothetical protein